MSIQEVRKEILKRIKSIEAKQGRDDVALTQEEWDARQAGYSSAINAYVDVMCMLDKAEG